MRVAVLFIRNKICQNNGLGVDMSTKFILSFLFTPLLLLIIAVLVLRKNVYVLQK